MTDILDYARGLVRRYGVDDPRKDVIRDYWEEDPELTEDEIEYVYLLWHGATVTVVLDLDSVRSDASRR